MLVLKSSSPSLITYTRLEGLSLTQAGWLVFASTHLIIGLERNEVVQRF